MPGNRQRAGQQVREAEDRATGTRAAEEAWDRGRGNRSGKPRTGQQEAGQQRKPGTEGRATVGQQ